MRRAVLLAVLAVVANAPPALAQEMQGPQAGTWGAEGHFRGASLLLFRSPSTALLLGATVGHQQVWTEGQNVFPDFHSTQASVRIGFRRYTRSGVSFRPFWTVIPFVSFGKSSGGSSRFGMGGALEFGAMHFFSPHLGLGASGELRGEFSENRQGSGPNRTTQHARSVALEGARLLAAVYF